MQKRLTKSFYIREDVLQVSKDLLGKHLVTNFDQQRTVGKIVETEAYRAPEDKASHAYGNRYTERTKIMFQEGGVAYVYLIYGLHHLFNVVTATDGIPHAVLIRAVEPVENIPLMLKRRDKEKLTTALTAGPGTLAKALGITIQHTGISLIDTQSPIWIEHGSESISDENIITSPRVGIDYAGEAALWDWRFRVKDSKWTSKAR